MARFKAPVPVWDSKRLKWRLSIPATVSVTGKQAKRWFDSRKQALSEVDRLKQYQKQVGSSATLLDAGRLLESSDCWRLLDEASVSPAPPGSLRRIVQQEIKLMQQRAKSVTPNELFEDYDLKLQRMHRSDNHRKGYRWLKGYLDFVLDKKVSDLTVSSINAAFAHLPDGNKNFNLRLLRALLSHAVHEGWAQSNPASQIEFIHKVKEDIQPPLPNDVVQRLLDDAAENHLSFLPSIAIPFFTRVREAELARLLWGDVHLDEKEILLRASISKTKRKRLLPVMPALSRWLDLYFQKIGGKPDAKQPILNLTAKQQRDARNKNWTAASQGTLGPWQQNCKRITFATNHACAFRNLSELAMILGHTSLQTSFDHYIGMVPADAARAFFDIVPRQTSA